ncbi:MAG: O-antigen ligase family protein [Lentisphaeraceae bacterium]|nr:O-antigen ligase family protein [Lentisphaeraceae bacterium]
MYKAKEEDRIPSALIVLLLVSSFVLLLVFLIDYRYLPTFVVSESRQLIHDDMMQTLRVGESLGVFKAVYPFESLSLNYWGTLRFLTNVLLCINTVYLVAVCRHKEKESLLKVFIVGAVIVSVAGLVGEFYIPFNDKFWWGLDFHDKGVIACFGLNNHYGVFLSFVIPFSLFFIRSSFQQGNRRGLILWSLVYVMIFAGILVSYSRGAVLLSFIASVLTLMTFAQRPVHRFWIVLASMFGCIAILLSAPGKLKAEIVNGLNESSRWELYEKVPEITQAFFHGVGPAAYRFISTGLVVNKGEMWGIAHHSENTFFQVLQECGILNTLLIVILFFVLLYKGIKNFQKRHLSRSFSIPVFITLIIAFLHGLYDYAFGVPVYSFVIALFIGFLQKKGRRFDGSINTQKDRLLQNLSFGVPVASLFFLILLAISEKGYYKDSYEYAKNAEIEELSRLIPQQPSSWHLWYHLGRKSWLAGNHNLPFTEKCFKMAAINFPNHTELWHSLAMTRYLQGNHYEASKAYKIYYLLQADWKRKSLHQEASIYLEEYFDLQTLLQEKLNIENLQREKMREI